MLKNINTNAIHQVLNFVGFILAGLVLLDVNQIMQLGFSKETAGLMAAWFLFGDRIVKISINYLRDGPTGMFKKQPPVQE